MTIDEALQLRPVSRGEDRARAIAAWELAEALALEAERVVVGHRARAHASWRRARRERGRAAAARAARQAAFASGLLDAASAHERSALDAEARAAEADRRARMLRGQADARLRAVTGAARAEDAGERLSIDAAAWREVA